MDPRVGAGPYGWMITLTTDLTAARAGDETAFGRLVAPHRAGAPRPLLPHARLGRTTPRTRCRRRCCAPGAALPGFEGRSSLRSWLYSIATNVCLRADRAPPGRVLPSTRPAATRARPRRRSRAAGSSRSRRRARATSGRRPRRATSSARASSWRSSPRSSTCPPASAPCCSCATCSASRRRRSPSRSTPRPPPSTARCSGPTRPSTSAARAQPAGDAALARRPARPRASSSATSRRGRTRDVAAILALLTDDATFAMPPLPSGSAAARRSRAFLRDGPLSPRRRWRLAPARQRAARASRYLRAGRHAACGRACSTLAPTAGSRRSRRSCGREDPA